ncbi:CAP domain-containing protein [Campylobacter blaseri]|uniref:CAP domain-containing protein n=1 Tax=Campylobacter blaseri TaxID=2042961 RepID=UPI00155DB3B8|nr:CAP domain-containing protein [Campylobacter blaseri]QKF85722.1 CAP domain-containing protein [Campylobacter blaseri]
MPKPVQKYSYIFLTIIAIFFTACDDGKNLKDASYPIPMPIYENPIDFLNAIRIDSGLNSLALNQKLSDSSLNHAKYLYENNSKSHYETENNRYFTGISPKDRAFYVGYNTQITENISINSINSMDSIDGLLSAIYHRFNFLDPTINEIGYGFFGNDKNQNYVYNMGNSNLNEFCQRGISDKGYGKFYSGYCKEKDIAILESNLDRFKNLNFFDYVVYPNSDKTKSFFSNEDPNPFPECKITSNPVSIEFNKQGSLVTMVDFKIFKNGERLLNTKQLTSLNDVNSILNKYQFALFSKDVFDFNQEYLVEFDYIQKQKQKTITWKFKTKTPQNKYFVANNKDKLSLSPNIWYDIFLKPENCNDVFNSYQASYKLMKKPDIKTLDTNMLRVKLNGLKNSKLTLKFDNNKEIYLILSKSSESLKIYENKFIYIIFVAILITIFYIIKRR